jgi:serine/threonine protein kinase
MTAVGTPLFCAPEIARGESYDEKVDVYSFGLLLVSLATVEEIGDFIGERWRIHFNKTKVPNMNSIAFNKVLRPMWEDGWRPVTLGGGELPHAPLTIVQLVVRCCDHDPGLRPSFGDVLRELGGPCAADIDYRAYVRRPPPPPAPFAADSLGDVEEMALNPYAASATLRRSSSRRSSVSGVKADVKAALLRLSRGRSFFAGAAPSNGGAAAALADEQGPSIELQPMPQPTTSASEATPTPVAAGTSLDHTPSLTSKFAHVQEKISEWTEL